MKTLLSDYTNYNSWANERLSKALLKLTDDQWNLEQKSSFTSIRKTAEHLADCEYNWLKRIGGNSDWEDKAKEFAANDKMIEFWLQQSKRFIDLVQKSDDKKLEEVIAYKNSAGTSFTSELYKIIAHIMNHSTYHRGQLVTLMRGAGFTELGSTDWITYYRSLMPR